jgi:hypothetical protein
MRDPRGDQVDQEEVANGRGNRRVPLALAAGWDAEAEQVTAGDLERLGAEVPGQVHRGPAEDPQNQAATPGPAAAYRRQRSLK